MNSEVEKPLLVVEKLNKNFYKQISLLQRKSKTIQAVKDVSFSIFPKQTFGIVGESGCGKTTLVRCILQVIKPSSGSIYFNGENLTELSGNELRKKRSEIQMVFQNPFNSLNPRMSVLNIISEPLRTHTKLSFEEIRQQVLILMEQVGLEKDHLYRYPHEFSGGQLQRVAIARALSLKPKFLALDEPTSALDVSVQAQIITLLQDLQAELELTYLFISHNLTMVHYISDVIAVMYLGQIVEKGLAAQIFDDPQHPYTQVLLSSTPSLNLQNRKDRILTTGSVPDASNPPPGCAFHPRCPFVKDICKKVDPELIMLSDNRQVSCHLFDN